jgi:hypothetical protein
MHVVPRQRDSGVYLSEIVFVKFNSRINAHWNEFAQNRWIFAISRNIDGFAYFPHKCGGFLKLTQITLISVMVLWLPYGVGIGALVLDYYSRPPNIPAHNHGSSFPNLYIADHSISRLW